eukprot:COSAG04_NODE_1675_length_5968_cov_2.264270_5_plen_670_part_01
MELPSAAGVLGVLWQVALVGTFLVNRLDYTALRDGSAPSHRSLLGGADDETSQLRTDMEQLGARVGGLERTGAAAAELRDEMEKIKDKTKNTMDKVDELRLDFHQLRAERNSTDPIGHFAQGMSRQAKERRADKQRPKEHHGQEAGRNHTARHRKQENAGACDSKSWAGRTAAVMEACCPGGHRRMQAGDCALPDTCPSAECADVFVAYYDDCQGELQAHAEDLPLQQFQGFYASCQDLSAGAGQMLQPVTVQMFHVRVETGEGQAQSGAMFPGGGNAGSGGKLDPLQPLPPPSPPAPGNAAEEAHEYQVACRSADVASCVPPCNPEHHGYELLATIDGTDTKFSCKLAHGLYSWVGAASEGGYLGSDFASFFSAVVSGAAGTYIVTLTEDAEIGTDLTIRPGQDVRISGDPGLNETPGWGTGGFTVEERGSLSLTGVTVNGLLEVQGGGSATVSGGSLALFTGNAAVSPSTILTLDPQCYQPYTTLNDVWRASGSAAGSHCDAAPGDADPQWITGVGGGGWYRFVGAGGDALPLSPQGGGHCGTTETGWLTAWHAVGSAPPSGYQCRRGCGAACDACAPPSSYEIAGRYPTAAEGVVEMTACFQANSLTCNHHADVGVVRCEDFLLWRLHYADSCYLAYCTAPSGLTDGSPSSGRRLEDGTAELEQQRR